mmetsp:Transcript_59904/g.106853  ORF Transcript_59904/g.106853 Transcript_59904/m.106853 type:complete len:436 (+) Transcript_59904:59-1366(+)
MFYRHVPVVCKVFTAVLVASAFDGGHSHTLHAKISERAELQVERHSKDAFRSSKLIRRQASQAPPAVHAQHAAPVDVSNSSHAYCDCPPELTKYQCSLRLAPVFVEQIAAQLRPFADVRLTPELLDAETPLGTHNSAHDFIHITIHNGNVSFYPLRDPWKPSDVASNRLYGLLGLLNVYVQSFDLTELPEVDFIYNLGDWPAVSDSDPRPIFSMTHVRHGEVDSWSGINSGHGHLDILFPSPMFCYWPEEFNNVTGMAPYWEDKDHVLFWRGSNTGYGYRHALVSLGPSINATDLHFSACCCGDHNETCERYLRPWVQMEEQAAHKYMVDVDGHSFSTRFKNLLATNSLVFKQKSPYKEWYYDLFEPGVHYIQLERDLSDLSQKVQWAREHDSEARSMADLAKKAVLEHVTFDDALCYIHQLLTEYQKLVVLPQP